MKQYFHNIFNGIQTVFEGMSITLASMFVPAVTVQYPDVDVTDREDMQRNYRGPLMEMPKNYRGILEVNLETCTACLICMRACPIDCIKIESAKCDKVTFTGKNGKKAVKTNACTIFDIDIAKCMFCGLCVDPCPTGALYHTQKFEMNTYSLDDLVLRFVDDEEKAKIEKRGAEIEEEKKREKAAKEAAKKDEEAAAPTEAKGEE